jgi:SAM-dependent methyltransferase
MKQTAFQWTRGFWQNWRESENPYRKYKSQRDRELALKASTLQDGERVLEVGCGYGWISQALWEVARIEWFGVDLSPEMVSDICAANPSQCLRASVADACQLPYQNEEFDKVVCTGVLMHIREDASALSELVRVLRPSGVLTCSITNALSPFSFAVRIWNSRKVGFVQKFRIPASFRELLKQFGMRTTEILGDGIFVTVPLRIGKFHFPPIWAFSKVSRMDQWMTARFPWLAYEVWFRAVKEVPRDTHKTSFQITARSRKAAGQILDRAYKRLS